jgi:hypothetical protein
MSATYRHFFGPRPGRKPSSNSCKKENSGLDIYSLARRLLANGTIHPETRLETWRLAVTQDRCILCMSGTAAELAKWRVVEDDVRGLGLIEYRPFPYIRSHQDGQNRGLGYSGIDRFKKTFATRPRAKHCTPLPAV